jgi:HlyD family secretion protein
MKEKETISVKETMEKVKASGSRRRLKYWIVASCLLLAVAGTAMAVTQLRSSGNATGYETHSVRTGNLQITVTATGNLEATNQVEVGSELSGIITAVKADYNTEVMLNQPLAYLDDTKFKAAVLKSKAEVTSAKAKYREARATKSAAEKTLIRYRKTRELTKGKLPSLEDLEQAETELERAVAAEEAAAAGVEIAEASLTLNETDLEKTIISSPINGVVLIRNVEEGQTVAASLQAPVLFTLAEDLKYMDLQVDVDEADVGQVREGQQAAFSVAAYPGYTFTAEITQVRFGSETTDGVVTYKTVLKVANPDLLLRPGMTATADIVVRSVENELLVPNSALLYSPIPQQKVKKEKQSLVSSLLPGPRRRPTARSGGAAVGAQDSTGQAQVWFLDEQRRPIAVTVERIATDGIMTAVKSAELQQGTMLITNEILTGRQGK